MIHPRVSVSAVSSYRNSLAEDLALWEALGVRRVGLTMAKLDAVNMESGARLVADAGLDVTNVIGFGPRLDEPDTWAVHVERLLALIGAARVMKADRVVLTTGPAGPLSWEAAADALHEAIEPLVTAGFPLVIEHTNSLRADVSFVHTLRDAVDLARELGTGVLCELNACWAERGLEPTFAHGLDVIELVQVSDFVVGTRDTPNRAVPGDGDIPLARIIGDLLDVGYDGDFDLELIGPRIEEEGYESAIPRGVAALSALLAGSGR